MTKFRIGKSFLEEWESDENDYENFKVLLREACGEAASLRIQRLEDAD